MGGLFVVEDFENANHFENELTAVERFLGELIKEGLPIRRNAEGNGELFSHGDCGGTAGGDDDSVDPPPKGEHNQNHRYRLIGE